jgi:hypothetical protein
VPNTILTEENGARVAKTGAVLMGQALVLAKTVTRDFDAEFDGGVGSKVRMRRPALLTASRRSLGATTAITVEDLAESGQDVALTHTAYHAAVVTQEDLTLNLEDFAAQVLMPQVDAVAADVESAVVAALQSVPQNAVLTTAYSATDPLATFIAARKALRGLGVPLSGGSLYAAVGDDAMSDLLATGALRDASQSGTSEALRNASPGKVYGFEIVESSDLAADEIVFYHKAAVALVLRAPQPPESVSYGVSVASDVGALTHLLVFDGGNLTEKSVVQTFVGCQTLTHPSRNTGTNIVPAVRIGGAV